MYGSSLTSETLILRDSRIAAREAAAMPLPRDETTPPVTKTYLVMTDPRDEIDILQEESAPGRDRPGFLVAIAGRFRPRGASGVHFAPGVRHLGHVDRVRMQAAHG